DPGAVDDVVRCRSDVLDLVPSGLEPGPAHIDANEEPDGGHAGVREEETSEGRVSDHGALCDPSACHFFCDLLCERNFDVGPRGETGSRGPNGASVRSCRQGTSGAGNTGLWLGEWCGFARTGGRPPTIDGRAHLSQ